MSDIAMFKIEQGMVKALNDRGVYVKTIGEAGAVDARFQGDFITIQYKNGTLKLYNKSGVYVKTL